MHHRGRPLTRRREMEAREKHGRAMNAVLEELKIVQAAEQAAEAAVSPAQQRAQQWQSESGRRLSRQPRSTALKELGKVVASHVATPTAVENVASFFMRDERSAVSAPSQPASSRLVGLLHRRYWRLHMSGTPCMAGRAEELSLRDSP